MLTFPKITGVTIFVLTCVFAVRYAGIPAWNFIASTETEARKDAVQRLHNYLLVRGERTSNYGDLSLVNKSEARWSKVYEFEARPFAGGLRIVSIVVDYSPMDHYVEIR